MLKNVAKKKKEAAAAQQDVLIVTCIFASSHIFCLSLIKTNISTLTVFTVVLSFLLPDRISFR